MVRALGLDAALNEALLLLKIHAPYFESDHVLNMTYSILTGGDCLEDLERLREDETYMDAIGAERIPDPTGAGDFCRRFMEFKKFIHDIVLIPCQIVKKARHLVCRILSYNSWLVTFFQTYDVIRAYDLPNDASGRTAPPVGHKSRGKESAKQNDKKHQARRKSQGRTIL